MLKKLFSRKAKKKVVVLGLDGVPCSLLKKFARNGVMPHVAELLEVGTLAHMKASIPEVSSTSWSTFMTGVNPGRHGIYGFMDLTPENYAWKFPNANDMQSKTIWEIAGEHDKRSVIINVPSTYPAKPLNGKLVAGFVALDLKKASYPESMYDFLKSMNYRLDVNASKAVTAMEEFKDDIMQTFQKRQEAIRSLYDREDCDLFVAAITETDRLHHYLWSALEDSASPHHEFFINFYRQLDQFIGSFVEQVGEKIPFIMLSDHGFTRIEAEIYLNHFLRQKGYLKLTKEKPKSFEDLDFSSQAFALDPSRIYIHRKNRFANGSVRPEDYENIRNSLKQDLLSIQVNEKPVIKEVRMKEDLYEGRCYDLAPDLVCLPHEGFDLKGSLVKEELSGTSFLTGGHTRENATFFINKKINCDRPDIIDVGPTILQLLDLPASGLQGRSLVAN